ncbi:MAG: glycosyltransferase family 2 protein [Chloroflexota bacterium]
MPDISLITSLYRSDEHLPTYIEAVEAVARDLALSLEVVIVANDATEAERHLLDTFALSDILQVTLIYCPRETLYASWNRGIALANSDIMGFWNVDDFRTVEGLQTGYKHLSGSAELVELAFEVREGDAVKSYPPQYQPDSLSPKACTGPFFMFHREVYTRAGEFNPHFRISGDYEWCKRSPVREANVVRSDVVGGTFVQHDSNLSGGRNPRQHIEYAIALLMNGGYHLLRPIDPTLFQTVWAEWGDAKPDALPEALDWLIGDEADARYADYEQYRQASVWEQRRLTWTARLLGKPTPVERFQPPATLKAQASS